jgi:hypothetical protein
MPARLPAYMQAALRDHSEAIRLLAGGRLLGLK